MTTRGLDLFNPMNLMHSGAFNWQGEIIPTADPEGRLCQFDGFINGIRAGTKNLVAYFQKDGCKTIRRIITRYAPGSENPTSNYIDFVARWCAVQPDSLIDLDDPSFAEKLVAAIIHFEQGCDFCTPYQIHIGVSEAYGVPPAIV